MDRNRTELTPHPGTKRLIAYRQGTLPAAEHDAIQEHLSLCPRCTGLLRELREFEAAAESGAPAPEAAPDSLREEAWASLVKKLPERSPAIRPVAQLPQPREPFFARAAGRAAIAALLIVAVGLGGTAWRESQRLATLQRRLLRHEIELSAARLSLAEAGHRLGTAEQRLREVESEKARQIAELSAGMEPPARTGAADVEVALTPRFVLRGEEPPRGDVLHGGGEANRIRSENGSFTVGLGLSEIEGFPEIRLEIVDRGGRVVWSGRRPGEALGDDGASLKIQGLGPGRYRLRVEGLKPDSTRFLGEYVLDVT